MFEEKNEYSKYSKTPTQKDLDDDNLLSDKAYDQWREDQDK